jgi:putative transposase
MNEYRRKNSLRLPGWDYTSQGGYFITIVTHDRLPLLGQIQNDEIKLNEWGEIINRGWLWLEDQYPYVILDDYVIMPNHFHGILWINVDEMNIRKGGSRTALTTGTTIKTIGRLVGAFKTVTTKQINLLCESPSQPVWQRSYHDHIIRNDEDLSRIRNYINSNPEKWPQDKFLFNGDE